MSLSASKPNSLPRPRRRAGERLRVLQMIDFLDDVGGAERFTSGLARGLPQSRFETWVCSPRGGEPAAVRELQDAGVRFVDLGRREKLDYHRVAGLASLLRSQRFDVLHSHMFGSNVWGSIYGRACGVPVLIAHEHTWSYEGDRLRAWLDGHLIGRLTTRFVAVSAADARRMVSVEGVPAEKVTLIPTAYIPRPSAPATDVRAELGIAPTAPLFGTATVMRAQKALSVVIAAHSQILRTIPDAHLLLAGDGEERAGLERQVRDLKIESRTHFIGRRNDVDAIIRALDVGVMCSDFEGLPLFAFECMANRTPLVATRVGGLPDIIEDDRSGLLVAPRQPGELATAIAALLTDPDRRRRLADAAAEQLSDYSMEQVSGRFADLYESLIETRSRKV